MLVAFLYNANYHVPNTANQTVQSRMIFHARVFAIAEPFLMPSLKRLAASKFSNIADQADLDACIAQLFNKQLLHEALLREICEKTKEILMRESNVQHISSPVTVVGDIHGFVPGAAASDYGR